MSSTLVPNNSSAWSFRGLIVAKYKEQVHLRCVKCGDSLFSDGFWEQRTQKNNEENSWIIQKTDLTAFEAPSKYYVAYLLLQRLEVTVKGLCY